MDGISGTNTDQPVGLAGGAAPQLREASRLQRWALRQRESISLAGQALRDWGPRQIVVATLTVIVVAVVMGTATVLIPNPFFARDIPTVPWNYPVWILSALLMGVLAATYTRPRAADTGSAAPATATALAAIGANTRSDSSADRGAGAGGLGGILAWFAVGCPVCNKIALVALGYTGALTWFAPLQPLLAGIALVILVIAVIGRLRGQISCPAPRTVLTPQAATL